MSEDVVAVALPDQESRGVLTRVILPASTSGATPQNQPVVVIVGGQPGAGKTEIADLVQAALDHRGGAVRICRDLYKAAHQRYGELLAADVRTAGGKVRSDTRRWQAAVEDHVRARGFDAVIESALADADELRASAAAYRRAGCQVEVVAVAAAEAWSQLGVLDRFLTEERYVSWENHDTCATQMLRTLAVIEAEGLADRISVVRRDFTVLYDNELVDGAWRQRPAAERTTVRERGRPWSARETATFRRGLARTDRRVHRELVGDDRRLAVQRDAERAAALAEPVRRIAQPRLQPPGVDYHRLSAAEHQWIFDELIAPSHLGNIVPQPDPRAVYVIGQPGASKTSAATLVQRAMRPGTTRLVGDDFKAAHPDYQQLLQDDPRGAGAAIRADYRSWFTQAETMVRSRRGDVLIEAAPGNAQEWMASALPFASDGYPVELVVLAVREADSRLATALRYARAQQLGLPARFTTKTGHSQCFRAVPDVVELAASHPAVTAVTVIRRDGHALLRQEHGDGRRAAWALAAERHRPYTEQEAAQFLTLYRALRTALPRHRRELDDIAALARPLMPAQVQPARIDPPHPPTWPLPLPHRDYDCVSSFSRAA
ncbi:zeta toxin family protein [Streptomyces sp. NPDC048612]|uniref:zeta toxin family protein n=1 Tax=Streptomyces sp. NPDC048612 TaxID=3365579 RepID=UPI003716CF09